VRQQSAPLRIAAKLLGYLLVAIGAVLGLVFVGLWLQGDRTAMLGTAALALAFGIPGWLFASYAAAAERREKAAQTIQKSDRFTIDQVALLLESTPEVAHAFIAAQIARHGLQLIYQPDIKGYARRALAAPPPAAPCPSCGVAAAPTEAGFCPNCGARRS